MVAFASVTRCAAALTTGMLPRTSATLADFERDGISKSVFQ